MGGRISTFIFWKNFLEFLDKMSSNHSFRHPIFAPMTKISYTSFASTLLEWHSTIDRNLPWKATRDPYKIWLSEIILQQTRVAQGTPYYLRFVEAFPSITDLANADEATVMKLWQGLGYYSRARNLHHAAKTVRDQYEGAFPEDYDKILALKGVGKYTAAAVASFAFDLEYPVVDGNVIRVISRYFGITDAVDTTQTIKHINLLAEKLIKGSDPASYNQAIMDFGALMCTPKNPNCLECPFKNECIAYASGQVDSIPFKTKKIKKKNRFLHYFYIIDDQGRVTVNHRNGNDIWKSLYDFPGMENSDKKPLENSEILAYLEEEIGQNVYDITQPTKVYKHVLTHQNIFGQFYIINCKKLRNDLSKFRITTSEEFERLAFPVLITRFLEEKKEWTLF